MFADKKDCLNGWQDLGKLTERQHSLRTRNYGETWLPTSWKDMHIKDRNINLVCSPFICEKKLHRIEKKMSPRKTIFTEE